MILWRFVLRESSQLNPSPSSDICQMPNRGRVGLDGTSSWSTALQRTESRSRASLPVCGTSIAIARSLCADSAFRGARRDSRRSCYSVWRVFADKTIDGLADQIRMTNVARVLLDEVRHDAAQSNDLAVEFESRWAIESFSVGQRFGEEGT